MPSYYFPHREALVAGLQLVNDPAAWNRPAERLRLGNDDTAAWLIVTPEPLDNLAPVDVEDDGGTVAIAGQSWPVTTRSRAPHLYEAVPLVPTGTLDLAVVYWVTEAPGQFLALAQTCLQMDNDRLQYLPLGGGRTLLRVEQLSAFLWHRWRPVEGVHGYLPARAEPRLLQPAGWRFPLPEKLSLASSDEAQLWLLSPETPWTPVRGPLADIYERIVLDTRRLESVERVADGEVPKLRVALRLEPADATAPARLWWLPADATDRLDRLVSEASEEALGSLQIACLSDAAGFVIHARPGTPDGAVGALSDVPGWAPWLADEHLYLPVGFRLAPLLSRASLVETLRLDDSRLSVVTLRDDGGLRVEQLQRDHFRPLAALADYYMAQAAEPISQLLAEVTLDDDSDLPEPDGPADEEAMAPSLWERFRRWLGI